MIEDVMERSDMSKLQDVMEESILAVAEKNHLEAREVIDLLEKLKVNRVAKIRAAIDQMGSRDAGALSSGLEKVIHAIAIATDLDTDEITDILTARSDASLEELAWKLREKSRSNRWNLGAV